MSRGGGAGAIFCRTSRSAQTGRSGFPAAGSRATRRFAFGAPLIICACLVTLARRRHPRPRRHESAPIRASHDPDTRSAAQIISFTTTRHAGKCLGRRGPERQRIGHRHGITLFAQRRGRAASVVRADVPGLEKKLQKSPPAAIALFCLLLFLLAGWIGTALSSGDRLRSTSPVPGRAQPVQAEPKRAPPRALLADSMRFSCTVEGVHDGDGPIYCRERDLEGRRIKIRLGGIAAREVDETCRPNQPCPEASALEATNELLRLARGRVLQCRRLGMSYARTVAYCSNGTVDLSCAMIRSGKALRWEKYDLDRHLIGCARAA